MATSPALGPILTDPSGMTLYPLSSDPKSGSLCAGVSSTVRPGTH